MKFQIAAFADESSAGFAGQLDALKRNGYSLLEIRNLDGKNVKDLTVVEAKELKSRLDDAGVGISSIGSPVGKIDIDGDFPAHLEEVKRILEIANILDAHRIRLFSFYMPKDRPASEFAGKAVDQLSVIAQITQSAGVIACHENEKGIFGDTASRCLLLHKTIPEMKAVFDPANFVQCGQNTLAAWDLLSPYVEYVHIKDALPDGQVVAPGDGAGNISRIIANYRAIGGKVLTLEPHLFEFAGLKALEQSGNTSDVGGLAFDTAEEAFDYAARRLNTILEELV